MVDKQNVALSTTVYHKHHTTIITCAVLGEQKKDADFQWDILDRVKHIEDTVSRIELRKSDFQDEVFEELMKVKKLVTSSDQILKRVLKEAETVAEVFIFFL